MELWDEWMKWVRPLEEACSRRTSAFWMMTVLAGFCIRDDLLGATSFVRALRLRPACYKSLINLFHSDALDIDRLTRCWSRTVLRLHPGVLRFGGMLVMVVDIIKVAKEGRKMPSVKKHHQESASNSKPEYIMGHLCQSVGVLAGMFGKFAFIPFASRIHEGLKLGNFDKRTPLDKLVQLLDSLALPEPFLVVADAYYGAGKLVLALLERGAHLITRCRSNGVAYEQPEPKKRTGRGRPKLYGRKVHLRTLFDEAMTEAPSPVYGDTSVMIGYCFRDLIWRPSRSLVRFVAVDHPKRGRAIFMHTDTGTDPLDIVRLYGYRFKIEVAFKHALHVVGVWTYRFWMAAMEPLKKGGGTQHLHRKSKEYRERAARKMRAYHRFIQLGLIAQGVMVALATTVPGLVGRHFCSWFRTMPDKKTPPSERIVGLALKNAYFEFLEDCTGNRSLVKFLRKKLDPDRIKSDLWAA